MHEFPDDNKQRILEPKIFNIICEFALEGIIFVVEVLESKNKIFQEYFLDNSEIFQQKFQKTASKKSIFKIGSTKSINKVLEKCLRKNFDFRKPVLYL